MTLIIDSPMPVETPMCAVTGYKRLLMLWDSTPMKDLPPDHEKDLTAAMEAAGVDFIKHSEYAAALRERRHVGRPTQAEIDKVRAELDASRNSPAVQWLTIGLQQAIHDAERSRQLDALIASIPE